MLYSRPVENLFLAFYASVETVLRIFSQWPSISPFGGVLIYDETLNLFDDRTFFRTVWLFYNEIAAAFTGRGRNVLIFHVIYVR
jgi:hypothetical protein